MIKSLLANPLLLFKNPLHYKAKRVTMQESYKVFLTVWQKVPNHASDHIAGMLQGIVCLQPIIIIRKGGFK